MYKSREIRWFFRGEMKPLAEWFLVHGWKFENAVSRTDFYNTATLKDDLGVKIREGRLEIKQRISVPYQAELINGVHGYFEEWIKWGFGLHQPSAEIDTIQSYTESQYWIGVHKERMAVKLTYDRQGKLKVHHLNTELSKGCQIEYSKLIVADNQWYSFGLEWFGEPWLQIDEEVFGKILGKSKLPITYAKSYPQFLLGELDGA